MAVKRIKLRLDTEANFIEANPLLLNGEVSIAVLEDGKRKIKIGDGYTSWVDLPYRNDQDLFKSITDSIIETVQSQGGMIESIENNLETLEEDLHETVETQSQHSESIEALQRKDDEHDEAIGELSETVSHYEAEFDTIGDRLQTLEDPRITEAIVTELRNKNTQQDGRIDTLEDNIETILDIVDSAGNVIDEQQGAINNVLAAIDGLTERVIVVETDEGLYNNKFTGLETEIENNKTEIESIKEGLSGNEGNYSSIQNQIEQVNESLQQEISVRDDTDTVHEAALNSLNTAQINEQINRIDADTALGARIDQEIDDRDDADYALGARIDQEIDDRDDADYALGARIDQEIDDRDDADTALEQQITSNHASFQEHENSTTNPHSVTKSQVGLSEVDNTSDADKPVSTAQQEAITETLNTAKGYTDEQIEATVAGTLHFKGSVDTFDDLPVENNQNFDLWAVLDTGKGYYWFNDEWNILDFTVDLSHYYLKTETDSLLGDKVDKVEGKGLSQNDFSDQYLQLLQATSGALKVFHDNVIHTSDVYEDILVTRYMFRSDLSITGSYLEIIIDGVSFRIVATSTSNLRTEVKSSIPDTVVNATIRRNTFYDGNTEGQTIQNRELNDTPYVIDSTIYVNSNDYSIYQILINNHWWEINLWPANAKSAVLVSLERRL